MGGNSTLSDKAGNSTHFIEFMLGLLNEALELLLSGQNTSLSATDRVKLYKDVAGTKPFSRQMYLRHYKEISQATASRDLKDATLKGILKKKGDKRFTLYTFKK